MRVKSNALGHRRVGRRNVRVAAREGRWVSVREVRVTAVDMRGHRLNRLSRSAVRRYRRR